MASEDTWTTELIPEAMRRAIRKYRLTTTRLDQCVLGLRDAWSGKRHHKPTLILSNDLRMVPLLGRRCVGGHEHQRLEGTTREGPRCRLAENDPLPFARAVVARLVTDRSPVEQWTATTTVTTTVSPYDTTPECFPTEGEAPAEWQAEFPEKYRRRSDVRTQTWVILKG